MSSSTNQTLWYQTQDTFYLDARHFQVDTRHFQADTFKQTLGTRHFQVGTRHFQLDTRHFQLDTRHFQLDTRHFSILKKSTRHLLDTYNIIHYFWIFLSKNQKIGKISWVPSKKLLILTARKLIQKVSSKCLVNVL